MTIAGAGENVYLRDRFVRQTVAERRRLDTQAGDRTTQRDRLSCGTTLAQVRSEA